MRASDPAVASELPPPSGPESAVAATAVSSLIRELEGAVRHVGRASHLALRAVRASFRRPFELSSTLHQMYVLGVESVGIATVTAVFVGMVMAVQFAYGLQKFGGVEYTGRIIALSFSRELAPTLTAVIVGGRIGAGITAELGAMTVTEQVDAIAALGADPVKKLVVPRLLAGIAVMPVLGAFSLVLGFLGAMFISSSEFAIQPGFFLSTALDSVGFNDYFSGMYKCPFFGAIIALVGCHFGLETRGGTEGVGRATTRTVVTTAIAILVADFLLTQLSIVIFPPGD